MRIGLLLEELIDMAQTAKTDFAINMNMTPSGLSKILKRARLPIIKEKRVFSRQAAAYFAESLYSYRCYFKFLPLFPVIYDFSSKYELEMFLSCALEYALDKDYEDENDGKPVLSDREASFLGKKNFGYKKRRTIFPFIILSICPVWNRQIRIILQPLFPPLQGRRNT